LGILALAYFCYDLRNNPTQPYAMRRFTPFAMPIMVAGVSAFPWFGANNRKRAFALVAATAAVLIGFIPINARMNSNTNFFGSTGFVESLARLIPSNAIVLIRADGPLSSLAAPLLLIHTRASLLVSPPLHDPNYTAIMARTISAWTHSGHPVFLLTDTPLARLSLFNIQWKETSEMQLDTTFFGDSVSQLEDSPSSITVNCILLQPSSSALQPPQHIIAPDIQAHRRPDNESFSLQNQEAAP
jgi:hypothetical protein